MTKLNIVPSILDEFHVIGMLEVWYLAKIGAVRFFFNFFFRYAESVVSGQARSCVIFVPINFFSVMLKVWYLGNICAVSTVYPQSRRSVNSY
jgi:hypothetical protein